MMFTVSVALMSQVIASAQGVSPLEVVMNDTHSIPTAYVAPPMLPATYLMFIGEELRPHLEITLVNSSDETQRFITAQRNVGLVLRSYPEGRSLDVPNFDVPQPEEVLEGTRRPVRWDDEMVLAPHEQLLWTLDLGLPVIGPGIYAIELALRGTDENRRLITQRASTVYIEVRRPTTNAEQKEIAVRSVVRFELQGRRNEALEAAIRAVQQHPESVVASELLAELYETLGGRAEAIASYSRAIALLQSNADPLFTPRRSQDVQESIVRLRSRIQRLR